MEHPIGHRGNPGIVGDDEQCRSKLAIGLFQRFEHANAGMAVECPGGFVAQQDAGLLCNRACNGDALLFTAGKLGGIVVLAISVTNRTFSSAVRLGMRL